MRRSEDLEPFKTHNDSPFTYQIVNGTLIIDETEYEYDGNEALYDLVYAFYDLALAYTQDI